MGTVLNLPSKDEKDIIEDNKEVGNLMEDENIGLKEHTRAVEGKKDVQLDRNSVSLRKADTEDAIRHDGIKKGGVHPVSTLAVALCAAQLNAVLAIPRNHALRAFL